MQNYLLIFFLTFSLISFGQTLEETESFIKKYIEAFPQNNGVEEEKNLVMFKTTEKGDYVFVYIKDLPNLGVIMSFFSPKDVESIILDKASMKNKNCIIRLNLKPNSGAFDLFNDSDEKNYIDKVDITIGNASYTEDYPNRIKKAIEHLVELDGGKIIKDKF